jgi:hypothetical protein
MLPPTELARLDRLVAEGEIGRYSIQPEGGMTCVVLHDFRLAAGFTVAATDLLLRLPSGFPDSAPDMFWCDPSVARSDGVPIPAADQYEQHVGRRWQRFSRHLAHGEWRPGVDSLDSFIVLIRKTLAQGLGRAA